MKRMTRRIMRAGFALPTVLIASVVMLAILSASVAAATSTRTALMNQYYESLANDAAESGLEMAKECIAAGYATWPNPLRPGGTCTGLAAACTTAACYVVNQTSVRTSFEVSSPTIAGDVSTVKIKGTTERLRKTGGGVMRSYGRTISKLEVTPLSAAQPVKWDKVAAGGAHTCGLTMSGVVYCWGSNTNGRLGDGTTTQRTTPTLIAQGAIPTGVAVVDISASGHSCAIGSDGKAYCWGLNTNGRLGDGTTTQRTSPVAVAQGAMPAGTTIVSISTGTSHTCAVVSDGKAYCWGLNTNGRLGDGTTTERTSPVAVAQGVIPAGTAIVQISAGHAHTCATAADGKAYCWGDGGNGRLGTGGMPGSQTTPAAVAQGSMPAGSTVMKVFAGGTTTCASIAISTSHGRIFCWGDNALGQVGNNTMTSITTYTSPTASGGNNYQDVSAGSSHICALLASTDGMHCWGFNSSNQIGDGTVATRAFSVSVSQGAIPAGVGYKQISATSTHTCVVGNDDVIYCWGSNSSGKLGDGTTSTRSTPVAVSTSLISDTSVRPVPTSLTLNYLHSCATGSDGMGYCWGYGNTGRLGYGGTSDQRAPIGVVAGAMPGGGKLTQISVGWTHSCGLAKIDGWMYCWGSNSDRQFGNGTITNSNTATPTSLGEVFPGRKVTKLTTGQYFVCGVITNNARVYCWGRNTNGQLGNNTTSDASTPVWVVQGAMPASAAAVDIAAGNSHACAIAHDRKVYCWGLNTNGQLGNNSTTQSLVPVAVSQGAMPAGAYAIALTAGASHTCAIASNAKTYCWGSNSSGQLGNNSTTQSLVPVAVSTGAMPNGGIARSITAGAIHTCAMGTDNKAYCWGSNGSGRLGDGTTTQRNIPTAVSQGAMPTGAQNLTLVAGYDYTCAIAYDRKTYCWGGNTNGKLGDGTTTSRSTPVQVQDMPAYPVVPSGPGAVYYF